MSVNPVLAGLAGRCPNCGEGPLFAGFLKVAPRCEACGFDLTKADSGDGPPAAIICLVLLRPFKGVMVALQFHNRAEETRHGE